MRPAELGAVQGASGTAQVSFASVLKQGLDSVNQSQCRLRIWATRFERGEPGWNCRR